MSDSLLRDGGWNLPLSDNAAVAVGEGVQPAPGGPDVSAPPKEVSGAGPSRPEGAVFDDIPRPVWRLFLVSWAAFLIVLWAAFGGRVESAFAVGVATFFAAMYFVTPRLVLKAAGKRTAARRPTRVVETSTGPLSIASAAIQILVLPVGLTIGMAIIALVIK